MSKLSTCDFAELKLSLKLSRILIPIIGREENGYFSAKNETLWNTLKANIFAIKQELLRRK